MDTVPPLGRNILDQLPTFKTYIDLHTSQETSETKDTNGHTHDVQVQTFSFGPHERHRLDFYTTSAKSQGAARPLLIFLYGGGLANGDRSAKNTPFWHNLGTFFTLKCHMDTVIPDYRLISHGAKYPSGGEDVGLTMDWVAKHHARRDVYVLANSAGGIHLSTWLFAKEFAAQRADLLSTSSPAQAGPLLRLQKVVFASVPMRFFPEQAMTEPLAAYIGTKGEIAAVEPTELMIRATQNMDRQEVAQIWPEILSLCVEFDPDIIGGVTGEFAALWRLRGGRGDFLVVEGHNHFSNVIALGLNDFREESWAYAVAKWLME